MLSLSAERVRGLLNPACRKQPPCVPEPHHLLAFWFLPGAWDSGQVQEDADSTDESKEALQMDNQRTLKLGPHCLFGGQSLVDPLQFIGQFPASRPPQPRERRCQRMCGAYHHGSHLQKRFPTGPTKRTISVQGADPMCEDS